MNNSKLSFEKNKPHIICIQESRLKNNRKSNIQGYNIYRKDRDQRENASGGVAILIKNSNTSTLIPLHTNLEALAVQIDFPGKVTICNIYIPPDYPLEHQEINKLTNQLPTPYIITGDFNAHHVSWGAERSNSRGKIIKEALEDLVLLNEGTPILSPIH